MADRGELVLDEARRRPGRGRTDAWVVEGDAVTALRETGGLVDAEELVVGARGHSGLRSGLGSVSRALVRAIDHAVTPGLAGVRGGAVRAASQVAARRLAARLRADGLDATVSLGYGHPSSGVAGRDEPVDADVAAIGAGPYSAAGAALCDGGAAALPAHSHGPLMVVSGGARSEP